MADTLTFETATAPEKDVNADHQLKVWKSVYEPLERGIKNFEVRLNDRQYSESGILHLCEYDRHSETYTGRSCLRRITYILFGGAWGIEEGYIVMGLEPLETHP